MNLWNWIEKNKVAVLTVVGLLVSILVVVLIAWYLEKRKKKFFNEKEADNFIPASENDIKEALRSVKEIYGAEDAKVVEQLFRWETSHFKSGGFKATNAPGMEATTTKDSSGNKIPTPYPYGWGTMREFWDKNPQYKPIGIYSTPEGTTGIVKPFLIFPTVRASMLSVAYWLQSHRPGNWYSKLEDQQEMYEGNIFQIIPRYSNTLA